MNRVVLLIGVVTVLAGCAPFEDSYYLDREYGKASQAAWDAQVVRKNHPYADRVPEGMPGITSEEVVNIQNKTYAEKPRKSAIFDFDMGK